MKKYGKNMEKIWKKYGKNMENQNHIQKISNIAFDRPIRGRLSTNSKIFLLLWMKKYSTNTEQSIQNREWMQSKHSWL